MFTLTRDAALNANLAALGERNRDVVEALRGAAMPPDLEFIETAGGVVGAVYGGRPLCSRHRPREEAARLIDRLDLVEHAVVVVFGFGLGYHVQELARRLGRAGLIIVFEPDRRLLRAVLERLDHAAWMRESLLLFVTDADDRAALAHKLDGAEAILAQGIEFLEHPASRSRLGTAAAAFSDRLSEHVAAAKTTLMTTLMRSVDTVRNFMLNLDHYALGAGVADLAGMASGFPAVVVSAGPSLQRNLHRLAAPGVRDRCVIIAVQTTLRPLLEAGVRPHFVTALDFHEISRRFYEELPPADLSDVTLVVDPKVHPVVIDAYPGPVRCAASGYLDGLLGPLRRDMGELPAGATVAHLAVYLARHLGCDPIAMIGQDLGFTDGLYYAPGTAIHDVWAPELGPFNTIEMMEWQRIVRHKVHLQERTDVHGRPLFSDQQMLTYLHQFERDFGRYREEGLGLIDATEGGLPKQHTERRPLADVLDTHATKPLPALPVPPAAVDESRRRDVLGRLAAVRQDVQALRVVSGKTIALIRRMLDEQADAARMERHFKKLHAYRREVEERFEAFKIINELNQLGVFKRLKADRRLHMQEGLDPLARQRAQLERDLDNVTWIADAADELVDQLTRSEKLLRDEPVDARPRTSNLVDHAVEARVRPGTSTVAAVVPLDPERSGLGHERSLAEPLGGRSVLQVTLERLSSSGALDSIVLVAPRDFDLDPLVDRARLALPLHVQRCNGSPFGPERAAVAAARWFADTAWRAGVAGMSIYDEVLCPGPIHEALRAHGLDAAVLVGPDWPLVNVTGDHGCDALVRRFREHPDQHRLVFTQAPPGLGGCLLSTALVEEMRAPHRLRTVGARLVYQPHVPQGDPIARDANVQIPAAIRRSLGRFTFDTARRRELIRTIIGERSPEHWPPTEDLVAAFEAADIATPRPLPQHAVLELGTERVSTGAWRRRERQAPRRGPLELDLARRIFDELSEIDDVVLTLDGAGDPLRHPAYAEVIALARAAGVRAVHLRTELLVEPAALAGLLASGADIVSVDLHADRAATYEAMMGVDRFRDVLVNIQHLIDHRHRLTEESPNVAFALPWIVPRLQRCAETMGDVNSFYDRWTYGLGAAVIDPCDDPDDPLLPTWPPARVQAREASRRMTILADGSVPRRFDDFSGADLVGNVGTAPVAELWAMLQARRDTARGAVPGDPP